MYCPLFVPCAHVFITTAAQPSSRNIDDFLSDSRVINVVVVEYGGRYKSANDNAHEDQGAIHSIMFSICIFSMIAITSIIPLQLDILIHLFQRIKMT